MALNSNKVTKVLWFSRHTMTSDQRAALGDNVEVTQINRVISNGYELQEEIEQHDVIAIVAPIHIQEQILRIAGDKPVIMALNNRVLVPNPDGGDDIAEFHFVKWERLVKIVVEKEDFMI